MTYYDVRANCPTCGDITLHHDEITVRTCLDDGRLSYTFDCPLCGQRDERSCGYRLAELLRRHGARCETYARASGPPPLTMLDLLHFTIDLTETDHLAAEAAQ